MTRAVTSRVPPAVPAMVLAPDSSRFAVTSCLQTVVPLDQLVGQLLATIRVEVRPAVER